METEPTSIEPAGPPKARYIMPGTCDFGIVRVECWFRIPGVAAKGDTLTCGRIMGNRGIPKRTNAADFYGLVGRWLMYRCEGICGPWPGRRQVYWEPFFAERFGNVRITGTGFDCTGKIFLTAIGRDEICDVWQIIEVGSKRPFYDSEFKEALARCGIRA